MTNHASLIAEARAQCARGLKNDSWADVLAAVDRLADALEAATQWRPIETAPRDGAPILAAIPARMMPAQTHWRGVVFWSSIGWLVRDTRMPAVADPTHWLPLPQPPEESE